MTETSAVPKRIVTHRQLGQGTRVCVLACVALGIASTAFGQAVVTATVIQGNPCADSSFRVRVAINNNSAGAVGTYAFLLKVTSSTTINVTSAADVEFGAAPTMNAVAGGTAISAFNAMSQLQNGALFDVTLNVTSPGQTGGITIRLEDFGQTPLFTTFFSPIEHTFNTAAVSNLCGPAVTDTPTQAAVPTNTPTATFTVPPPTATATATATSPPPPTATPTHTTAVAPTATPTLSQSQAVIRAEIATGNPCSDSSFTVRIAVSNNAVGPVGTYAFVLGVSSQTPVTFGNVVDGAFGAAPTSNAVAGGTAISAFNATSTLQNGVLCVVTLNVQSPGQTGPVTITLTDYGQTPLYTTTFSPIPHGFDTSAVANLCGAAVTETPTQPAVPTNTPTTPPTETATATFTSPPPTVTPTNTTGIVPTATPTVDPSLAVVRVELASGNPCSDSSFAVRVSVSNNAIGTVGTYAFLLGVSSQTPITFGSVADGAFGAAPTANAVVGGTAISAFNATSTLQNGVLCVVTLNVQSPGQTGPVTITLTDYGQTPLYTTGFAEIRHRFDLSAVRDLCLPPTDTPTMPAPTDTPTQVTPPTDTPTHTARPTDTPTLPMVDFDEDGLTDALESRRPGPGTTNWILPDSDGDALGDGTEDANRNGRVDVGETNPRSADSDGDGLEDGVEVLLLESNPLNPDDPGAFADADSDGLPASMDPNDNQRDSDGDRFLDAYEAVTVGLTGAGDPQVRPRIGDLDGDGTVEESDGRMVSDIWLDKTELVLDRTRYADVDRDGWVTTLDAMLIEGFVIQRVLYLPAH